jgi:hypothetical protein
MWAGVGAGELAVVSSKALPNLVATISRLPPGPGQHPLAAVGRVHVGGVEVPIAWHPSAIGLTHTDSAPAERPRRQLRRVSSLEGLSWCFAGPTPSLTIRSGGGHQ